MKKRLLTTLLSASIILSMTAISSFAETTQPYIYDVEQLKIALQRGIAIESLNDNISPQVTAQFMEEKLNQAVEQIDRQEVVADMQKQVDGSLYDKQTFDLGDGCELVVELSDKSETQSTKLSQILLASTSDNNTQWYGYGNRSFTAKASVNCGVGTAYMSLTNHYTLSINGIDERTGTAACSCSNSQWYISRLSPQTTDSVARAPGASDVNMDCTYKVTSASSDGVSISSMYKLNTTIGYLNINKLAKQIRVKESWSLSKIS